METTTAEFKNENAEEIWVSIINDEYLEEVILISYFLSNLFDLF